MKQETVATIIKWSEETFGDNITLEGQLNKFKEEKAEWLATNREDIEELADLAIVASSIARFSVVEAMFCFGRVEEELCHSIFTTKELEEAINKKQSINRQRKWTIGKGNFQHVGE